MSYIYRARQQARLRRYIGATVGKYETTKQGVSYTNLQKTQHFSPQN